MRKLDAVVREYHWGSRTALAEMRGEPSPSPTPQAELWVGAHPDDPSRLAGCGVPLDAHLAANPAGLLGPASLAAFGPRLPFLLKVLAVDAPLSLQVHPDRERARTGFAEHGYRDDRGKPEVLVALTDFETLSGFRDPAATRALLRELGVPGLDPMRAALAEGDTAGALRWALREGGAVVDEVARAAADVPALQHVADLARAHPADAGVVAALLLNAVVLEPGQAVYVRPGVLHAHLRGVGVELMANSDNVLRAGLTPKPVDVPGVLSLLDHRPGPAEAPAVEVDGPLRTYRTPDPEFRLHAVRAGAVLPGDGPQLLLCTGGSVVVARDGESVALRGGESAFLPHDPANAASVTGDGEAFWATVGG
ncbi:mannose-6-phosphate isomerase, class I [Saccharothrix longispora]|uniref:mannose-6-phosphate isomerase, class I n=1 Tax=Saccharothrix longispora TaxID=33920 RepID=UPI0028FDBA20|nr:mannose-6-phosphate isomerase, class I [Saccharothrix longispora]MBY8848359.1 mannose-6-phosphate isomerase, class I [Saccharothrix sp. MB29]MDU0290861.1 mannose-6-phosphate isomerase, class I [Saccharothrix longispora]